MTAITIYPDISIYQNALTAAYPRRFVMWRIESEYAALDGHARTNLAVSAALRASGHLDNFGGYVIPDVVSNAAVLAQLDALNFPHDAVVMIDFESWGGKVTGDRSTQNNQLADALRARQHGRADLVFDYFNRSDGRSGWPTRPSWLGTIIAGYSSDDPRGEAAFPNVIGWQYTNGTENHTAWPSSTPGLGACDHNALFIPIPLPGGAGAIQEGLTMADVDTIVAKLDALRSDLDTTRLPLTRLTRLDLAFSSISDIHEAVAEMRTSVQVDHKVLTDTASGLAVRVAALQAAVQAIATAGGQAVDVAAILDQAHADAVATVNGAKVSA